MWNKNNVVITLIDKIWHFHNLQFVFSNRQCVLMTIWSLGTHDNCHHNFGKVSALHGIMPLYLILDLIWISPFASFCLKHIASCSPLANNVIQLQWSTSAVQQVQIKTDRGKHWLCCLLKLPYPNWRCPFYPMVGKACVCYFSPNYVLICLAQAQPSIHQAGFFMWSAMELPDEMDFYFLWILRIHQLFK